MISTGALHQFNAMSRNLTYKSSMVLCLMVKALRMTYFANQDSRGSLFAEKHQLLWTKLRLNMRARQLQTLVCTNQKMDLKGLWYHLSCRANVVLTLLDNLFVHEFIHHHIQNYFQEWHKLFPKAPQQKTRICSMNILKLFTSVKRTMKLDKTMNVWRTTHG